MSSDVSRQARRAGARHVRNKLYLIGPKFWNVRGQFKVFKVIDIETQMSIIKLSNGKFLIVDTIEMDDGLRQEINNLTNNGSDIEAVIGTHPFHTSSFSSFYRAYPQAAYYGTPRHLRRLTDIPWAGDLQHRRIRKQWEPDVEMRIPAGVEFVNPQPEVTNHFASVFVYHPASQTLHVNDTIMYVQRPNFLLRVLGCKAGAMAFHPSLKSSGLYPTSEAPYFFRDWLRNLICDWSFENMCCAHLGVKIGSAYVDVAALVDSSEPLFAELSEKYRKQDFSNEKAKENTAKDRTRKTECG